MDKKQFLIGVDENTKKLIDKYKQKGFETRSKYIKSLLQRDNILDSD